MYNEELTTQDWTIIVSVCVVTLVLWLIRNTPFGFLWRWYKWFWIILFAILMANYVKKEIKDWWNKD